MTINTSSTELNLIERVDRDTEQMGLVASKHNKILIFLSIFSIVFAKGYSKCKESINRIYTFPSIAERHLLFTLVRGPRYYSNILIDTISKLFLETFISVIIDSTSRAIACHLKDNENYFAEKCVIVKKLDDDGYISNLIEQVRSQSYYSEERIYNNKVRIVRANGPFNILHVSDNADPDDYDFSINSDPLENQLDKKIEENLIKFPSTAENLRNDIYKYWNNTFTEIQNNAPYRVEFNAKDINSANLYKENTAKRTKVLKHRKLYYKLLCSVAVLRSLDKVIQRDEMGYSVIPVDQNDIEIVTEIIKSETSLLKALPRNSLRLLKIITEESSRDNGFTQKDLQIKIGWAASTISDALKALEKNGIVLWTSAGSNHQRKYWLCPNFKFEDYKTFLQDDLLLNFIEKGGNNAIVFDSLSRNDSFNDSKE